MSDSIFYFVEYVCAEALVIIGVVAEAWNLGEFIIVLLIFWATTMILFCMENDKKC